MTRARAGPLPSGIRTGADARVTRSARGSGRPGREPDGRRKTDAGPAVRDDADAGSGAARWDGTRTTGGVSWTDCVSRSRRASRTPLSSPPRTTPRSRPGSTPSALTLDPAARAAIDGHVRLLLAWTEAINLTAIREPAAVATAHVVDSLTGLGGPARARHRPVHRPRIGRRLSGAPARRGPAGRPCPAPRAGRPRRRRFLSAVASATGLADTVEAAPVRAEALARRPPPSRPLAGGDRPGRRRPRRARRARLPAARTGRRSRSPGSAATSTPSWPPRNGRSMRSAAGRSRSVAVTVDGLDGHRLVVATARGRVPPGTRATRGARKRRPW